MREVMWAPVEAPGIEHLCLGVGDGGIEADGLVVGIEEGQAFRLSYEIRCDARWRVREVRAILLDRGGGLHLHADGEGRWTTGDGRPLPELDGCIDVDLSATPFTNTLPIRRLGVRPGGSAQIVVAWIAAPDLSVEVARQRYTRLDARPDGGRYRFEALPNDRLPDGFVAELAVDGDGLVVDYPGLFRRVWAGHLGSAAGGRNG
ncbi:MAG: putative glycolipid-binding domain-containing protein [Chloroflexota bacterium]|nr:putative glycolipid-binding domain-containing protein [Chloroflexota bacterium]